MHALLAAALLATASPRTYGPQKLPEVAAAADPLVDAAKVVPHLSVDLRYATSNNFAGRPLYPNDTDCLLRRSVAERLALAARTLAKERLRLVAWDCLRTPEAQMALWEAHPVPGAVAEPGRGSLHERGVAGVGGLAGCDGDPGGGPRMASEVLVVAVTEVSPGGSGEGPAAKVGEGIETRIEIAQRQPGGKGRAAGALEEIAARRRGAGERPPDVRLARGEGPGRADAGFEEPRDGECPLVVAGQVGQGAALRPPRIEKEQR